MTPSAYEIIPNIYLGTEEAIWDACYGLIVQCTNTKFPSFTEDYYPLVVGVPIASVTTGSERLLHILTKTNTLRHVNTRVLNETSVLFYCSEDMLRSSVVLACYLMKYERLLPMQAIDLIKSKYPMATFDDIEAIQFIDKFFTQLD